MLSAAVQRHAATSCALLLALVAQAAVGEEAKLPPPAERTIDFATDVRPIFETFCFSCHDASNPQSNYRLDHKAGAFSSGDIGQPIVPGNSADSPLIHYVGGLDEDRLMPADGERLSAEQVSILRAWIDQGARWDESADAAAEAQEHWAYKALVAPEVPPLSGDAWIRTPIDAFILAKLQQQSLAPSVEADKRTLLRRLTFDLTGLAPTPEEMDAFLSDEAPDAYERAVDRLLASPRYGERWARHWMDVVHFAETHGNDQDRPRPNAWPYRDYLIRAFNDDKPYTRFVREQLAGDVIYPGDPDALVATAMLAAGPWDESSQRDIVDDTIDKKIAQNLDRDDMVTTVLSTFSSSTVHCARCHNHKFDPISQKEYYNLQAVFAGVDRAEREYDLTQETYLARKELHDSLAALREDRYPIEELLAPATLAKVEHWEASIQSQRGKWTVLHPQSVSSSSGAKATQNPDGSVLFGGDRPDKDTYTFTFSVDAQPIHSLAVEVLVDDALPLRGPGRQDNGNLHLSEVRIERSSGADSTQSQPVVIRAARADFDQTGWTASMTIDNKPETAWGIYPEVSKSHWIIFDLEPFTPTPGTILTVKLEQLHGGGHLIGRPRVSVSPLSGDQKLILPDAIASVLDVPSAGRTEEQRATLAKYVVKQSLEAQLAQLPAPQKVYTITNLFTPEMNFKPTPKPRPIHVLHRGEVSQPGEEALPAALSCLKTLDSRLNVAADADEGARRAAFAEWVVDKRNALTWRSIVNRVWHYHFGRGIVDTPNDFGRMGGKPSHPELLDWLAVWFRDNGSSMKALHKLIVTSSVYRQASHHNEHFAQLDALNVYLWRMNRHRLDAESVRDAILQASGKLDLAMGGPSVKLFIETPGIHVTPNVDYMSFDLDAPGANRRSVYRFLFRTLPDPLMETLDCPDGSQLAPQRTSSVTALQALSMLNNRFVVHQCEHFANRVSSLTTDPAEQVRAVYRFALNRQPNEKEVALTTDYLQRHGLSNLCRLILNSNEFLFID